MQFEIIGADIKQSFVVQGCAGSGKSQCLLHRLFFLRDELSQEGWEHVLLITPTQLFRNYSADLMRRYQLTSVSNCSIAELYQTLLNTYDARFKNRQYRFELTEEYLPDEYLHEVYEPSIITRIDSEIQNAIHNYILKGCLALGVDVPEIITAEVVDNLVKQLDEQMQLFDERELVLQQDKQYADKREKYEELLTQLDTMKKRGDKLSDDSKKLDEARIELEKRMLALQEAKEEKEEWIAQREENDNKEIKKLSEIKESWDKGNDIQLPARYAQQLAIVEDLLFGERKEANEEYAHFLDDYCEQMRKNLLEIIKNQSVDKVFF